MQSYANVQLPKYFDICTLSTHPHNLIPILTIKSTEHTHCIAQTYQSKCLVLMTHATCNMSACLQHVGGTAHRACKM